MPSAFIPFCSHATNVATSGHRSSFPACNIFKPVIMEGQQCFQMVMDRNEQTRAGKDGGVLILLDTYNDRSVSPMLQKRAGSSIEDETVTSIKMDPAKQVQMKIKEFTKKRLRGSDSGSKVFIQTLQGFTVFEAGSYVIRNIKKMSATTNFLGMDVKHTKCQAEPIEECLMRSYIEAVTADCKCVPLAIAASMFGKVGLGGFLFLFDQMREFLGCRTLPLSS